MRVDWALLCRYVETDGTTATIVGAGIDTFGLAAIPGEVGTWAALRVSGSPDELGPTISHQFSCRVLDSEMQEIVTPLETGFQTGPPAPDHQPGWTQHMVMPIFVHFHVEEPGIYTLQFTVDGNSETVSMIVHPLASPPEAGA